MEADEGGGGRVARFAVQRLSEGGIGVAIAVRSPGVPGEAALPACARSAAVVVVSIDGLVGTLLWPGDWSSRALLWSERLSEREVFRLRGLFKRTKSSSSSLASECDPGSAADAELLESGQTTSSSDSYGETDRGDKGLVGWS